MRSILLVEQLSIMSIPVKNSKKTQQQQNQWMWRKKNTLESVYYLFSLKVVLQCETVGIMTGLITITVF